MIDLKIYCHAVMGSSVPKNTTAPAFVLTMNRISRWSELFVHQPFYQLVGTGVQIVLTICNGMIYQCPEVAYIEHFNKKFNKNLKRTAADALDIYQDITAKDIFNFLSRPIPFCRYCDTVTLKPYHEEFNDQGAWMISKGDISDWIDTVL